jgi:hypothetical protein
MPIEVTCGHCHGDILVEAAGVTVACPLCGAHLHIPDPEAAIDLSPTTIQSGSAAMAPPVDRTMLDVTAILPAADNVLADAPTAISTADADEDWRPQPVDEATITATTMFEPPADAPDFSTPVAAETLRCEKDATSKAPAVAAPAQSAPEPAATAPAASVVAPSAPAMVPWNWFLIVASYASAVTIVLLYLLLTHRRHQLESLPDLVPKTFKGSVAIEVPAPQEEVAPGHVLKLGESQRFGSLRVTPVRITRGPIEFDHGFKFEDTTLEPSEPVLKLWLKFENVSRDQTFPPLDSTLVYKRVFKKQGPQRIFTNGFLCAADERRQGGQLYYVYELPELSEFVVVGQDLNRDLPPGDAWETFIPSQEEAVELSGDCVWRVQFRKGYNRRSGRGVTTLIDVPFHTVDIEMEAPIVREPEKPAPKKQQKPTAIRDV